MRYSEVGHHFNKHPKRNVGERLDGLSRTKKNRSLTKNEEIRDDLIRFFEENSVLDTRCRNEAIVAGEMKRKRLLKKPFWVLLLKYDDEKKQQTLEMREINEEVPDPPSISTYRRIYKENFTKWLRLADDNAILNCYCPVHLQMELYTSAINRFSATEPITDFDLAEMSICVNSGHRLKCIENSCEYCQDTEAGYEHVKARLEDHFHGIDPETEVTYAQLVEIERTDANQNPYKREQLVMQLATRDEFISVVCDYLQRGCRYRSSTEDNQSLRAFKRIQGLPQATPGQLHL
ncbi:Oidioi.mRNA.OKI2018_I69.chr1.g924.t1.cds [Oikopleura dioica]|uniref:Oidioi.mRNA.OKI2018_I69.chr1.g924.t1.cds n=1 Tax=Oikopleura dioica TaxID=34765 RepID=A0ABN7SQL2_OIKDI|nr:Oidioi.mRNA.OKI2018_I69.chr1.g924.t1.cds [Oikopleura dioica]